MSQIGIVVIALVAALTGIAFTAAPELDLHVIAFLRSPEIWDMLRAADPLLYWLRKLNGYVAAFFVVGACLALVAHALSLRFAPLMPRRAAVLVAATFAIAPGLLIGVLLKPVWGRSRPSDIVAFGGTEPFTAWWNPTGLCLSDCSFASSETALAFAALAAAVVAPLAWRRTAIAFAIVFGLSIAAMRLALARHYPTDVIASALVSSLTVWALHGCLYRWPWARAAEARLRGAFRSRSAGLSAGLSRS